METREGYASGTEHDGMKHTVTISRNRYNALLRAENVARAFREAMTSPVQDPKTMVLWNEACQATRGWLNVAGRKENAKPPAVNRRWLS